MKTAYAYDIITYQESHNILVELILDHQHLLGGGVGESEEAPLGVVPRVRGQLLRKRIETLEHAVNTEIEVALGAVQRADDQVDNTEVMVLLAGVDSSQTLLFTLNLTHDLSSTVVLAGHDIRHAEVGEYDR